MASFDPFGCAQDRLPFLILGSQVSFRGAEGDEESFSCVKISDKVYPEQNQIDRFAQNDGWRVRNEPMMEKNWLFHYGDFTPDDDAPPEVEQEFLEQLDAESKEYGHALSKVRLLRPAVSGTSAVEKVPYRCCCATDTADLPAADLVRS